MPSDVSTQLKAVQKENSGGQGEVGGQRQSTRMIATVGSVAEISAITVPLSNGCWVRLDQIARVKSSHVLVIDSNQDGLAVSTGNLRITRVVMRGVHLLRHQF
ncbi:hypothetical protein [Comamonas sp.]|uniref:hypothetical protein n=1 Tax=Comamonas sp. TaxID=34028 RepID=UPI0028AF941B|nr:hypothetical protein [Comamonas sp.]